MGHVPRSIAAVVSIALTAVGHVGAQDAPPPDGAEEAEVRTFEFSAHRTNVLLTDDDEVLFDWSIDQYFEELAKHLPEGGDRSRVDPENTESRVEWVAPYDGVVWGRDVSTLAAQWYGGRRAGEKEYWTFFDNPDRREDWFTFPAASRLLGITDDFLYQGWCDNAVEFYPAENERESRHMRAGIAMAQQIFLSCAAPAEAFEMFAVKGRADAFHQTRDVLPDGRIRHEYRFEPSHGKVEYIMRTESAGDERPATWRFIQKNHMSNESLVFFATWRETTADSSRSLPSHPRDILESHADIEGIRSVGIRDRSGMGHWGTAYPQVEYLEVTAGVAVLNWFSADPNRLLTNGAVFFVVLLLLWRERPSFHDRHKEIER